MTKKDVKVLKRSRQSDVVNQNLELKKLFSILFPLKEEHTKMRIADAHKISNSIFKTKALDSNHERIHKSLVDPLVLTRVSVMRKYQLAAIESAYQ